MSQLMRFPAGFLWGASTSAYQIEGSPLADGAGPSIWHRFSHTPGRTANGETGDIACDHYNRYASDVDLMHSLGLNAYRFSIAWARIFPEGKGAVNQRGLDFYDRLIDRLLERGITPSVTLFHWDLPAALDDRGGWLNPDIASWFADYATAVFRAFDDRVPMWATLNEPWVVTDGGYLHGPLAPGHRSLFEAPIAAHHLLRSHGSAVQAYRAEGRNQIGLVVNLEPKYPASSTPEDLAATARADAYMNRQFLDPVFLGSYPDELREIFGEAWPEFPGADMDLIRQPIDFLGINYYFRSVTKHDDEKLPVRASAVRQRSHPYTETALHHRERRGDVRSAEAARRPDRGSAPRVLLPRAPSRRPRGNPSGCRPARLLRLVLHGQLRVESRLRPPLRHRARGLRDPGAHAEVERALLLGRHPEPRGIAGRDAVTRPVLSNCSLRRSPQPEAAAV
jgi:beta-glucosidase